MSKNDIEKAGARKAYSVLMIRFTGKKTAQEKSLSQCQALNDYAILRLTNVPMETKTFYSNSRCIAINNMRKKSVPSCGFRSQIFSHPFVAVRHVIESKREKTIEKENNEA